MGLAKSSMAFWLIGAATVLVSIRLLSGFWDGNSISIPRPFVSTDAVEPRFIFVDLGANAADSLATFLKNDSAKFKYDFPRPDWATYEQADIYLFEANPHFNEILVNAKQFQRSRGVNVNIFPSTVVDVVDGIRTFYLDTINKDFDFWGSSVLDNAPDIVASKAKGTDLSAINISRWLLMNTLPCDFVVVKMDVEGAEYELIPHMLEMKAYSVIDHLLVEWHERVLQVGKTPEEVAPILTRAKEATAKLQEMGVEMPNWV